MTKAVDDRRRILAEGPGRQSDGWSVGGGRGGMLGHLVGGADRDAEGRIDPVLEKRAADLLEASGLFAARDPASRVERALRRADGDGALKRAAFRARWIETGAPTSAPDEPELMIKVGVLFERIGEVVRDLEEGVSGLTEVSLVDALGAIDTLDERLGDIERWLRAVAAQQGVTVPAAGEGVRL